MIWFWSFYLQTVVIVSKATFVWTQVSRSTLLYGLAPALAMSSFIRWLCLTEKRDEKKMLRASWVRILFTHVVSDGNARIWWKLYRCFYSRLLFPRVECHWKTSSRVRRKRSITPCIRKLANRKYLLFGCGLNSLNYVHNCTCRNVFLWSSKSDVWMRRSLIVFLVF